MDQRLMMTGFYPKHALGYGKKKIQVSEDIGVTKKLHKRLREEGTSVVEKKTPKAVKKVDIASVAGTLTEDFLREKLGGDTVGEKMLLRELLKLRKDKRVEKKVKKGRKFEECSEVSGRSRFDMEGRKFKRYNKKREEEESESFQILGYLPSEEFPNEYTFANKQKSAYNYTGGIPKPFGMNYEWKGPQLESKVEKKGTRNRNPSSPTNVQARKSRMGMMKMPDSVGMYPIGLQEYNWPPQDWNMPWNQWYPQYNQFTEGTHANLPPVPEMNMVPNSVFDYMMTLPQKKKKKEKVKRGKKKKEILLMSPTSLQKRLNQKLQQAIVERKEAD